MDYTRIVTSTFGDAISLLADGNDNTFPVFSLAEYPNLYHILDFGADYKITPMPFVWRQNELCRSYGRYDGFRIQ